MEGLLDELILGLQLGLWSDITDGKSVCGRNIAQQLLHPTPRVRHLG